MVLDFEGIDNARDPGGMVRSDGRVLRSGLLLRTGRLENATDIDRSRLESMNLAAVIDFRDPGEVRRAPDVSISCAEYYSLPALPTDGGPYLKPGDPTYTAQQCHEDFRNIYRELARTPQSRDTYAKFFEILLDLQGWPILWHCTQGKDRTGAATMLLLTALGFSEEQILDEYMLTNDFTLPALAEILRKKPESDAELLTEVFTVWRENAALYLNTIREEHGTVHAYLKDALGIGAEQIAALEKFYLE